ncbi:hypothetical protein [Maricaulis maris]|uniref:hypothetical protein n=1 Tax=Maricaulis maris TaxID=74318 RepID=UPI003B8B7DD3
MTKVEAAYQALMARLTTAAEDSANPLPEPKRNEPLVNAFTSFEGGGNQVDGGVFLNVFDQDGDPLGIESGASDEDEHADHEFYQNAQIEWIVEHNKNDEREALFDAGMEAIAAALQADRFLGGAVDDLEIQMPRRANLALSGAPKIKAVIIPLRMLLTAKSYIG